MAIDKLRTNLYKIPHLSTMTYEDIKTFERDGVTPKNSNRTDEQQAGPVGDTGQDQIG